MNINNNIYNEMFDKEKKWIEQINSGLLNSIYCNLELKPFYLEIEDQLNTNSTEITKPIIEAIKEIINKIDELNDLYSKGYKTDMKELIPLFLTNKMNKKEKKNSTSAKIEVLKSFKDMYISSIKNSDDIYGELPEEKTK